MLFFLDRFWVNLEVTMQRKKNESLYLKLHHTEFGFCCNRVMAIFFSSTYGLFTIVD